MPPATPGESSSPSPRPSPQSEHANGPVQVKGKARWYKVRFRGADWRAWTAEMSAERTLAGCLSESLLARSGPEAVALVADAIKDVSKRKAIVLDPFSGSGTTIIAAEKTGRRARAIED